MLFRSEIQIPSVRYDSVHSFHLYVIKATNRDVLKKYLIEKGIETAIHYPSALPNLPAYRYLQHKPYDFPNATKLQEAILSLPMYPELKEEEIIYVSDQIRSFYLQ